MGAFDAPLTQAGISSVWAGHIIGALENWRLGCAWDDQDAIYQQYEQLIKFLGIVASGDDMPDVGDGKIFFGPESELSGGWLVCDGRAVSRATYADLFAVIGIIFGSGDGATTFNLPDARGAFLLGLDNMGGSSRNQVTDPNASVLGGEGGEETHTLLESEMPPHSHIVPGYQTGSGTARTKADSLGSTLYLNQPTSSTGGGNAHNNMPPWLGINIAIYAGE